MKVAFVDFDGVLNSPQTWGRRPHLAALDEPRVALLNDFCVAHNVSVVISSTWRVVFDLEALRGLLGAKGFTAPVIGVTPSLYTVHRSDEIRLWLASQPAGAIEGYVIFDDNETAGYGLEPHFAWIAQSRGLEPQHMRAAAKKLDAPV